MQEHSSQLDATEPSHGWTALHIAADKGFDVIIRELLARGAAPNLIDKEGRTALHLAAVGGHAPVVRDLLRKGADPSRRDQAGKSALDLALEKQSGSAAALLAEALANRGIPASTTPTGSPTAWQAQAQQQQQQQQQPEQARSNLANLNLNAAAAPGAGRTAAGGAGGLGSYPIVPAPSTEDTWLTGLPVPPGVSLNLPSAPPAPDSHQQQQQQQQQQAVLPDYYDYLVPSMATAAPGAPPLAAGGGGAASASFSPYPAVPSAAPAGAPAATALQPYPQQQQQVPYPQPQQQYQPQQQPQQQYQYQQQQYQQQQQPWVGGLPTPLPVDARATAAPPTSLRSAAAAAGSASAASTAAAGDDDDDDDWGVAHDDDDWGGASGSAAPAAAAGAGPGGSRSRPQQQGPDFNAAVGAAVSGAGKVAGAVASTAVSGAKNFLGGLLPRPPPGKRDGQGASAGPGSPGAAAARLAAAASAATTAGPAGRLYSYDDLARATQGFSPSNRLGAGGYGPVFRGRLDGVPVAVKLLDSGGGSQQGPAEFRAEVAILSRLHHPHIVLLMGSCPERCALVYELLDHGNLEQHLFSQNMPDLTWQDRIRIACEVVSALVFLHSASEPIIHMDLKPANLLLNKSLVCKVADVGLSRLMPLITAPGCPGGPVSTVLDTRLVGTPSYMDPEYLRTGRFGPRSDTFSLGVILLQMLTGLEANRVISVVEAAIARSQGPEGPASFATIIDPRAGSWPITEAACFAHLAMRCVELQRQARPDLRGEVLPTLLQLAERARLFATQRGPLRHCSSLGGSNQPPSMFICPITQDVMEDPVFAADGYTYEREAIAGWIASHNTSPMTNLLLPHTGLTPNLALRSGIREWQEKHGE